MSKSQNNSSHNKHKTGRSTSGSIDEVKQKLYSRMAKIKPYKRQGFDANKDSQAVPTSWKRKQADTRNTKTQASTSTSESKQEEHSKLPQSKQPMTVFTKILIGSLLFFIFSILAAVLVYRLQVNEVSYDAIDLSVRGPNTIAAGEELNFDVHVTNNNQVNVVLSDIVVNYPPGTIDVDDGLALQKDIASIDEIPSGLNQSKRFSAILFGAENDVQEITVSFQYRVPGSDILLYKERVYQVALESAPVVINSEHSTNFQSGDQVTLDLELVSNASTPLHNLLLAVDFPFGFEFASSTPIGIDPQTYTIGTLEPGERTTVTITGIIRGQDNEKRTFRYSLGSESSNQPGTVGTVFAIDQSNINLTKPPIALGLRANDDSQGDLVVAPGDKVAVDLSYTNNLDSKILDATVVANLEGSGYIPSSVDAREGYFQSSEAQISWTQSEYEPLRELEPQEGDTLSFSLSTRDTADLVQNYVNPAFTMVVQAQGTNFDSGALEEQVSSEIVKQVRISSQPGIDAYLLYNSGPFENTGPMIPEVETETTYTLVLEASNSTNRIEDTQIRATLPSYVSLRDIMQPSNANVEFDTRTREIIWNAGTLNPGVGYTGNAKRVYLSLAFEPSANQVGRVPDIVEDISLEAQDSFTQTTVRAGANDLSSRLDQDPEYDPLVDPGIRE